MDCRNELFGIAILWIIAFHLYENIGLVNMSHWGGVRTILSMFLKRGNLGVDIFLFLSAIGLCKSMQNNDTKSFYMHRFNRVVLPYLLIAIPFFVWLDLFQKGDGWGQLLLNITTIKFWIDGDHPTWYIAFIIIMYLLFPLFFRWGKKTEHLSTVAILILSVVIEALMYKTGFPLYRTSERALSRVPVFMIGLLYAPYVLSGKRIMQWQVLMLLFVGLFFFITSFSLFHIVYIRYMYCPISISIIVGYAYLRKSIALERLWTFFAKIGGYSLELYVIHVFILRVVKVIGLWPVFTSSVWWLFIPVISLVLALFLQLISKRLEWIH